MGSCAKVHHAVPADVCRDQNNRGGQEGHTPKTALNREKGAERALKLWVSGTMHDNPEALGRLLNVQARTQIANGVELQVLPIGDSITFGVQSTHGIGYRGELHDLLVQRGNKVNFVGGLATGSMADNSHEGHRAFVIDQISNSSTVGLHAAANIVLLHAGTKDMRNEVDPLNGPMRLKSLIDIIFENSPEAVVFVCQIIPAGHNKYRDALPRIDTFNAAIPDLVSGFSSSGKKVVVVPMNKAVSTKDLADNLYQNDIGYIKMANEYYAAIKEADARDWISAPVFLDMSLHKIQ
ncbi:FG-GAP repeat domain-containing protein [Verticillium dahliae VdLs.17]|uniref:FG-GAP repeat domain-containing protein n=1 Tax=Verticillium dahliae (strain VdLs.17 / ATCC MYA-4575 / FGSC 10137) TaxID=498257 RepID=G2X1M1_VERDV|nr:FG-GAP repeat domain-containing protein [Verticillium dahliae VdLs.17]EGY22194.1 FG-GAP repeat domain-containing protein [Verticillium dahliae VdLs.17]KAH6704581.1 FG-GAP repeat domain-containing protein [Verticillium dahliae]